MATDTKATNFTVADAIETASDFLPSALWGGKVCVQIDYDEVDSIADGSTIKVGKMPEGATIICAIVVHAAGTAAVTGTLGDAGDADRWGSFTTMAAAGTQVVVKAPESETTADITCGMGYRYTADTDIYFTTDEQDFDSDCFVAVALLYTTN